uniref:NADP-dependent oxidoreductase domain-containing protein n=2 Tax=Emiliania huxleyi TaxID=2903 RepID=A0A6T0HAS6_EMIHU|mmetsp:Transcript_38956/g.125115  ORF Transcript_38956/g.125115 Transcript_38956/m.125115 type:complete len:323 (+) Transcript_38956:15-983(+)
MLLWLRTAMVTSVPTVKLNDGRSHPVVGYGTYKVGVVPASASSAVAAGTTATEAVNPADCVAKALELGYRFLDCAEFYANEKAVGEGIAASGVPREQLFLASKCWTTTIYDGPEAVQAQLEKTLADLGTDYLDLYCIHWPVPGRHVAAYLQLEKAQAAGQVRSLGVSNYAVQDLDELMASGATVTPSINQIEINPFLYRKETIAAFESRGVKMQSYRTLRDGKAFSDPAILATAQKHGKTAAQVLGRWCVQHGFIAIPKSVKAERMEENLDLFDFELDADDMSQLDALTTPEAISTFVGLYRKCVIRDTPLTDGIKMEITEG